MGVPSARRNPLPLAGNPGLGSPSIALRSLAAALALACLLGCATEPRSERAVLLGSEDRIFLILPLNLAARMPPELEFASPIIWKELELYLVAQGKQLKTVSRETARSLWVRNIRKLRAGPNGARAGYDDAARALAQELRTHAEFDVMIAPSLFIREATISNRSARWDGVERKLEFEARGLETWRRAGQGLETWQPAHVPLEGVAPAASLHVAVFDAQGEKLHEAQGGLELLVHVRQVGKNPAGGPVFRFATRTDLFENREHVREGISAAFVPFLPPLPE